MKLLLKVVFYPIAGFIVLIVILAIIGAFNDTRLENTSFVQDCEDISPYYLEPETILSSKSRNKGVEVLEAKAVRSKDYKRFYFVQYKMRVPKVGIVYPIFAMNKPTVGLGGNGVIYSMNDIALELTGFGDARTFKSPFSASDDGYYRATKCLK